MNSMLPQPDPALPSMVRLPAYGNTVAAEDIRTCLVFAAEFEDETLIDASAVESIGQAVLQLLIAAKAGALSTGQTFRIVDPSEAFIKRVASCGLETAIGLRNSEDNSL
jgi:anti-anti-sigma regulatory factor